MKIHDITVPLSDELPTYPGDPPVSIEPVTRISRGDTANVSGIVMTTHSGTHLDAPRHFSDGGATVDHIPLTLLVGMARVVEIRGVREIGRKELARLPVRGVERILLRTDGGKLWNRPGFNEDFPFLTEDGARYLLEAGVKLVGIDYLSIERFDSGGEVHRLLLGNGVLILEGLNLEGVEPGKYELICLPLKVKGGDGAPVRALLRSRERLAEESSFDPHTTRWPIS